MRDPGWEETCESASGFGLNLGKLEAVMWILFYVFIFVLVSIKTMFFWHFHTYILLWFVYRFGFSKSHSEGLGRWFNW